MSTVAETPRKRCKTEKIPNKAALPQSYHFYEDVLLVVELKLEIDVKRKVPWVSKSQSPGTMVMMGTPSLEQTG